ncbi:hypothetical protein HK104_000679 [Borealophlyctis nickersoniae]|nr:hypothetical protein HK104_000679 [Borealophlyctis nickersoniae]
MFNDDSEVKRNTDNGSVRAEHGEKDIKPPKRSDRLLDTVAKKIIEDEAFPLHGMPKSAHTALTSMYAEEVGDRLKQLESQYDPSVPVDSPYIIRLDGVSFSKLTSRLQKPFDDRLTQSMIATTKDLVSKFNAYLGYTQSDEISLVFPAAMPKDEDPPVVRTHPYSGRIQKLASVTAGYASARLNHHLRSHPTLPSPLLESTAHFDARAIPLPSATVISQCIFWRSNFDGLRNAITQIAHAQFGHKPLHKKSARDKLEMLAEVGVFPFQTTPTRHLYGTWVKKELYEMIGAVNPRTGEPIEGPVLRGRLRTGSFNWADWTEEKRAEFVMAKYWGDEEWWPPKDSAA